MSDPRDEVPAILAGSIPEIWSEQERDALASAYKNASVKHGHYETLFAVARCAFELRAAPIFRADAARASELEAQLAEAERARDMQTKAWRDEADANRRLAYAEPSEDEIAIEIGLWRVLGELTPHECARRMLDIFRKVRSPDRSTL